MLLEIHLTNVIKTLILHIHPLHILGQIVFDFTQAAIVTYPILDATFLNRISFLLSQHVKHNIYLFELMRNLRVISNFADKSTNPYIAFNLIATCESCLIIVAFYNILRCTHCANTRMTTVYTYLFLTGERSNVIVNSTYIPINRVPIYRCTLKQIVLSAKYTIYSHFANTRMTRVYLLPPAVRPKAVAKTLRQHIPLRCSK